jgi:hypothetical protein
LSTLIEASLYAVLGFFVDMVSCRSLSTARVDIRVDKALKVQKKANRNNGGSRRAREASAAGCAGCLSAIVAPYFTGFV